MPQVTIVVVPRDRFSVAKRSLESIYRGTTGPFELVYVDGNSPSRVRRYLEREAIHRGFRLIRSDEFLSPNRARNLGLREVRTEYVAFVDNDVEVAPGWLGQLMTCAEETGAWAVGPLIFQGSLQDEIVHICGGVAELKDEGGIRSFREEHLFNGQTLAEVKPEIRRAETDFAEFHCVLFRREVFDRLGACDEGLLSQEEHLDLALLIRQAGGTVYVEPDARVAFPYDALLDDDDLEYARLRWSDDWNRRSTRHFADKWGLDPEGSWATGSIAWGNRHLDHLERLRRRPGSVMKGIVKGVAKTILPRHTYKALQALRD